MIRGSIEAWVIVLWIISGIASAQQWTPARAGWLYVLDVGGTSGQVLLIDPDTGLVEGSIKTGYHPSIGVCGDGSQLYFVSGSQSAGTLSLIDGTTGNVAATSSIADRAVYTVQPSSPGIGCSSDGQWLFIQTMISSAPEADHHALLVVSRSTGKLTPQPVALPVCGIATFVNVPVGSWNTAVECSLSDTVRFVSLDGSGAVAAVRDVGLGLAPPVSPSGFRLPQALRLARRLYRAKISRPFISSEP